MDELKEIRNLFATNRRFAGPRGDRVRRLGRIGCAKTLTS